MYDYIIVGSGIAGLFSALVAAEHGRVLVVTKAELEESNTRYAQGGIAAAVDSGDSPAWHADDTLIAGAGLCEQHAVDVLTHLAPDRISDLIRFGVEFDREQGRLALGREGAHGLARILHAGGDATGARIETALCRAVRAAGVDILERHFLTALLTESGHVRGVRVLDPAGREHEFEARATILASGGSGQLYRHTTNPGVATGDGLAAAIRAGALVADLEFYQFHPTALAVSSSPRFLISEAMRGEGGILRDAAGRAFMPDYDPRGDLASRDIVSRAILAEMTRSGASHVFLDVTHLPTDRIQLRFPTIIQYCADLGLDITREPIPVAPAAHYQMGGVLTNCWGETSLPGLFACGEVAASGVHGANRLASNSLLEGLVFGWRAVRRTLGDSEPEPRSTLLPPMLTTPLAVPSAGIADEPTLEALQALMWAHVGLTRTAGGLALAQRTLADWAERMVPTNRAGLELANLVQVGSVAVDAALRREESRGAHYRADFPESSPRWRRRVVIRVGEAVRPGPLALSIAG